MLYYVLVSEICMVIDVLRNKTELECLIKSGGIFFGRGRGPQTRDNWAPTPNLGTPGEGRGGGAGVGREKARLPLP